MCFATKLVLWLVAYTHAVIQVANVPVNDTLHHENMHVPLLQAEDD